MVPGPPAPVGHLRVRPRPADRAGLTVLVAPRLGPVRARA